MRKSDLLHCLSALLASNTLQCTETCALHMNHIEKWHATIKRNVNHIPATVCSRSIWNWCVSGSTPWRSSNCRISVFPFKAGTLYQAATLPNFIPEVRVLRLSLVTVYLSRAIAQVVSLRLPTAATRVRAQVWSCGICGGQSGTGAVFL
jgi:hypothetical protein